VRVVWYGVFILGLVSKLDSQICISIFYESLTSSNLKICLFFIKFEILFNLKLLVHAI